VSEDKAPESPEEPTCTKQVEIGKVFAGVISGAIIAILATGTQLFVSYLAYKQSTVNHVSLQEVKATGIVTERIVNSNNERLLEKVDRLEEIVKEQMKTIAVQKDRDDTAAEKEKQK